jgi:hypothetical protein
MGSLTDFSIPQIGISPEFLRHPNRLFERVFKNFVTREELGVKSGG